MNDLICIVDDDQSFRLNIARLLQLSGYEVAEFDSANRFLDELGRGPDPGCILLDIKLGDSNGPALQERLAKLGSPSPIIFLTGQGDVRTTVKVMKAGAEDVLTKPVSEQALLESVRLALATSQHERARRGWERNARALLAGLTPREREVFECVIRGKANKLTARELGITERTIKAHRQRIFEKMQAGTVADLVSLAERLGIIPHDEPFSDMRHEER